MAETRNSSVSRHAAIAAADRVKLLLSVVEGDAFLSEVLQSADRTLVDMGQSRTEDAPEAMAKTLTAAPRERRVSDDIRAPLLGPAYHSAKKRALRLRDTAPVVPGRPQGRA
ncbi:hypothetical protein [Antarcticimicrobium luteum]|uniref:Uncharacterized protein n=1 Tax=Antarcticimicrobium luteum TaxID=2547397 RepID=A0A4R5VD53_9RHOB|nr:hypothetical protein [Antarcticimicrobium luteum]TDK50223.1 hypothetical protein E1832_07390 [Antarcticimicrobium luteum]